MWEGEEKRKWQGEGGRGRCGGRDTKAAGVGEDSVSLAFSIIHSICEYEPPNIFDEDCVARPRLAGLLPMSLVTEYVGRLP